MKRKLYTDEINNILNKCKMYGNIPKSIKETTLHNILLPIQKELNEIEIYPEYIHLLESEIIKKFYPIRKYYYLYLK